MIDTPEKRRSAIDFGKGSRGTGMPIPYGIVDTAERSHVMNLYPGIVPVTDFFFFWRRRTTQSGTIYEVRNTPSSTWRTATDAEEDMFVKANDARDS